MRGQQVEKVQDLQSGFAGGMNIIGDQSMLRPDQARQLTNCKLGAFGAATKRGGTRRVMVSSDSASGNPPQGTPLVVYVAAWKRLVWTQQDPAIPPAVGNVVNLYKGYVNTYWDNNGTITATKIGALPSGYDVRDITIFTTGGVQTVYIATAAGLSKYDNTTLTNNISGAVACNGLAVYNNRLWGFNGNTLYYSAINDGDTLGNSASGGGEIIVRTFGTSNIVGLAVIGASLVIFHQQGISRLTGFGQDDINVEPQAISSDVAPVGDGTMRSYAIAVYANIAWVLSERGLWRVTESSVQLVSTPESPDPTPPLIASLNDPRFCVVYVSTRVLEVWCTIYDGTLGSMGTYVYNIQLNAWSGPLNNTNRPTYCPWSTWVSSFVSMPDTYGDIRDLALNGHLLADGSAYEFVIYEVDYSVCKDNLAANGTGGVSYDLVLQPHRMFAGDRQYSKAWRWITLQASNLDSNSAPTVVSTALNGGNYTMTCSSPITAQQVYYLGPKGVGPYLDMVITDSGISASSYQTIGVEGFFLGQR